MSSADADEDESRAKRALRTVTPSYSGRPNVEMDVIGWSILLGMILVLLPMLPFLVALWLIGKLLDALTRSPGAE